MSHDWTLPFDSPIPPLEHESMSVLSGAGEEYQMEYVIWEHFLNFRDVEVLFKGMSLLCPLLTQQLFM